MDLSSRLLLLPRTAVLGLIRVYQRTLSPDTGIFSFLFPHGYCRFHPTCSEYTYQAIQRYGIVAGSLKGASRILRCNPWNKGGIDYIT